MNIRSFPVLILLLFSSLVVSAWTLKGVGDFAFEKMSDRVYVMHGPLQEPNPENHGFMNNPGLIIAANGLIVVDPGSTFGVGEKVLEEIRKISPKPVLAVFNTHIHGDHWLGNQAIKKAFPSAKIYGHPKMIEQAKGEQGLTWVDLMDRLTKGKSKGTKVVAPDIAVKNGDVIKVDGQSFRIHHLSPAHTNTDIMVEHVESKTMFLGDNSFSKRMGRFDSSSDMHGNIKALQQARDLKMTVYVPGHGKSGDADLALTPFLTYLETLQKGVAKGFREEKEDYTIKKDIIGDFKAYIKWSGFDENFGKHVNKMYLEIEEREF